MTAGATEPTPAARTRRRTGAGLLPIAVLALVVGVQAWWQGSGAGNQAAHTAAVDLAEAVLAGTAALACRHRAAGYRANGPPDARRRDQVLGWRLIATGCASWFAGQLVWTGYEVLAGHDVPFPSVADVGFLGFPVLVTLGTARLAGSRSRFDSAVRALLDGLLVSGALFLAAWQLTLRAVLGQGWSGVALVVSVAYPVGDVLVLAVVLLLVSRGSRDPALRLLGAGLTVMAAADTTFVWLTSTREFTTGSSADLAWVAAFGLISLARWQPAPYDEHLVDAPPGVAALILPYAPVVLALGWTVHALWHGQRLDQVTVATATILVAGLIARQGVNVVEHARLVAVLRSQERRLRELAFADPLTGLPNRGRFADELLARVGRAGSDGRPVTVGYLDVDDFKEVNDRSGHAAGDELLRQVARRLTAAAGPGALVARLGGDEFGVLFGPDDARPPARLRAELAVLDVEVFDLDGKPARAKVSVGVVRQTVHGDPARAAERLLHAADEQMYRDKRARRTLPSTRPASSDGVRVRTPPSS